MKKNIRIDERQEEALRLLAEGLEISGQRGAYFQPLLREIGDIAEGALAETVAALEIARQCAAGGDWDELIQIVQPQWPEE